MSANHLVAVAKVPLSLSNKTRQKVPQAPFEQLGQRILGKRYELSLAFVGERVSRRLNKSLRGKDKPTDVLSFSLTPTSGEIIIDLGTARKRMKKFEMNYEKFITYLFIHGCLHLKGMEHGAKMEQAEKNFLNGSSNRSRH